MECYIYKITCLSNNKSYIGQTNNGVRRFYEHLYELRHNSHYSAKMQNSFNKYGESNFKFEVIETTDTENADDRERYWIDYYKSNNKIYGFNSESGGNKNKMLSEDHKSKISKAISGENNPMYGVHRKGEEVPFFGRSHTEKTKSILRLKAKKRYKTHSKYINSNEAIIKRSISNTGKKRSAEFRIKMSEIAKSRIGDKNSFYGKKHTNETKAKISNANKGGTGGGKPKKKIIATNIETGKTIEFNSKSEASKNGFPSRTLVNKVIEGVYTQYNGYKFEEIIS